MMLDLGSFVVGVLATLAVVTAWVNRHSIESTRPRLGDVSEPPSNVSSLRPWSEIGRAGPRRDASTRPFDWEHD